MITTREIISTGVTLDDFKRHLRITNNVFDTDLDEKLKAAHRVAEHYIGQILMKSRIVETMEFCGVVSLSAPLDSVTSVKLNNVDIPFTATGNTLVIPGTMEGTMEVDYIAGKDTIEYDIKVAILLIASDMFNNPVDRVEQLPRSSQMLLRPYRRYGR